MRYGLIFAITASIIVGGGLVAVAVLGNGFALDFGVFWRAAREPVAQIYHPEPWLPFVYPPTTIPFLKPLALLPFWPAFAMWSALSLVAFLAAARSKAWWLMLLSPGVIECLAFGQTSLFVGAVLLLACSRRGWQMGALLALALSLKPQMVAMAPLILLVRRDWPAIAGALAAGATIGLITTALFGVQIWLGWIDAMPGFAHVIEQRNLYWALITPYGFAAWLGLPAMTFWISGAALALLAVLRSSRSWDDLAMPIAVTSILAVPYAVPHDLVATLPWCASILLRGGRDWRQAPAALIFSATAVPIGAATLAFSWILRSPLPLNNDDHAVAAAAALAASSAS